MISSLDIESLKQVSVALPIYSANTRLDHRGKEWIGRCPLPGHKDDSASFTLTEKQGALLYHCFGCGKGGDVFKFIQEMSNCLFSEAVEKVKSLAGWKSGTQKVEQVFKQLDAEPKKFDTFKLIDLAPAERALEAGGVPLQWLQSRCISLETAKKHHLGFVQSAARVSPNHEFVDKGWIIFPTVVGENVTLLKYRSVVTKDFLRKVNMETSLYNVGAISPFEDVFLVEGECLLGDTEVLTPTGWVRLDRYSGENVLQWHEDGTANYVKPRAYTAKEYTGNIVKFCSRSSLVDIAATENHRIVYRAHASKKLIVRRAADVPCTGAEFYRTADLISKGISWSDSEIRMQVMIQADASWENEGANQNHHRTDGKDGWNMEFRKERKIIRARLILEAAGIPWTENVLGRGTTKFRFRTEIGRYAKLFPKEFYQMSRSQREAFMDEIRYWDTHIAPDGSLKYVSIHESNVDVAQAIFSVSNVSAKKRYEDKGGNRERQYYIGVPGRKYRGSHRITSGRTIEKTTEHYSGVVYCVTVPSSYIFIRRNGTISVTGNCDALTMEQAGYHTVALPGANFNVTPEMKDKLLTANRIFLAGDMDVPGQAAMTKLWTELRDRTYMLKWPEAKDANEAFVKLGGDIKNFQTLVEDLKNAALEQPMPFMHDLAESLHHVDDTSPLDNPARLRFPWPRIDKWTAIVPGDIMVLSATETGTGKTSLLMGVLLENAIKYGKVVANYSAELPPAQYARRAAAYLTGKNRDALGRSDYELAAKKMEGAKFYNGYKPGANWKEVVELLKWAKRRLGADILVIDHLHFLTRSEKDEIKSQSEAMRAFKDLAIEYGIILIVVGQPRKPKDEHFGRELQMRGIKGSESLSSDASQVFILHRKRISEDGDDVAVFSPETKVILDKSRESEGRSTKLLFRGETCRFVEMANGGMEEC